jgi:hypothetical protein
MIKRTEEEIRNKINELWSEEYDKPDEVMVSIYEDKIDIQMSSMYDPPCLSFALLMAMADFFGTRNINDDDRYSSSGCETCDYGSDYGFTLTIRPEKETTSE